jgi:hypothetical protein
MNVGQEVVCIKDHSRGIVREGEMYTVQDVAETPCCQTVLIDIGKRHGSKIIMCTCGNKFPIDVPIHYLAAFLFAPLDDLFNTEISELMSEVETTIEL